MTIDEMRAKLPDLPAGATDAEVLQAYGLYEIASEALDLIPLEDVKEHLRVTFNDHDTLITGYVATAIGHLDGPDGWLGRAITPQTIVERYDGLWSIPAKPSWRPVIGVTSIEYRGAAGWLTLDPTAYEFEDGILAPTYGTYWPNFTGQVRLTYRAGYDGAPGRVLPPALRGAILLMVGDLYRNPGEAVVGSISAKVAMSTTVANLLEPLRVYR